ncbi:MAG: S41 family peptidase [Trueperaceae bacterium]
MKRFSRLFLASAIIVLLATSFAVSVGDPWDSAEDRGRTFEAVVDVFQRNYWDPGHRDWQAWGEDYRERALSASTREEFDRVLGRMVRALDDEHSSWLGLVTYAGNEDLAGDRQPRFGFQSRFLPGTGVVVERVYPGSAAARAGLRRGDVVVSVDGRELTGRGSNYRVWDVLAAASERDTVLFELRRGDTRQRIELEPVPFELGLAREMPQAEMIDDRLGYLYLPSFNRDDIGQQVHRLLTDLQSRGLTELIVDLRGNPGGRIGELGLTLGAFLEGTWARATSRGDVVWQGRYDSSDERGETWLEDPNGRILLQRFIELPAMFAGRMVVLVDRSNSSAGELAAMVLQAQDRAVVVGEPTSGNVEAIRGFDLPDGSVVMVAVANLEGPDGASFSGGVMPDVLARESLRELAQGYDAPLAEAIRLLRGLPFTPNRYFGQGVSVP